MKTRIALCALTLGLFAVGCDDKPHNYSAISATPTPAAAVVPLGLPVVPVVPTRPAGPIRGGRGGTPKPPRPRDDHGTDRPQGGGSSGSGTPSVTPDNPGSIHSSGDSRDVGPRLDDCASFRALTGRWTIKVDDHWDVLNRASNKWVKKKIEERAGPFFSDALCEGLRTLRGKTLPDKNTDIAKQIAQRIGDKKLEILLTDDDEAGKYSKHHFLFFGGPKIKLGRRVVEGVIAAELPTFVDTLAPADSQLTNEKDEKSRANVLANQIQAAKATFFHYVMHMAGAIIDKDKHSDDSFLSHKKELDVIHACTAQVYPYFYVDAEGMDYKGRTERGPFYQNSNLACLTCATAKIAASGEIYATMKYASQEASREAQILCSGIKDRDPENSVTADRSANLYEEMK